MCRSSSEGYNGGGASSVSRGLLQWAVDLQQHRRRLFVRKAEAAVLCDQLARGMCV